MNVVNMLEEVLRWAGWIDPIRETKVCGLCGKTITQWTGVFWQTERDNGFEIAVLDADAIEVFCQSCSKRLRKRVYAALRAVVSERLDERDN